MIEPQASTDPGWKRLPFEWTEGSTAAGWELLSLVPQSKMLRHWDVGWGHFSKQVVQSEQGAAGAAPDSGTWQDRAWLSPSPQGDIHCCGCNTVKHQLCLCQDLGQAFEAYETFSWPSLQQAEPKHHKISPSLFPFLRMTKIHCRFLLIWKRLKSIHWTQREKM